MDKRIATVLIVGLVIGLLIGGTVGFFFSHSSPSSEITSSSEYSSSESQVTPTTLHQQENETFNVYMDGILFTDYFYPSNIPSSSDPSSFNMYGMTSNRDPVISGNLNVSWLTPLMGNFEQNMTLWNEINQKLGKSFGAAYRQATGIAVGPTEANNIVYVSSDAGWVYGVNEFTGKIIFMLYTPGTLSMWEPVVYNGIGIVGLGSAMFDYQQGALNGFGGGHRGQYTGINGLLAFNATTGKPLWLDLTRSQAMPTGVVENGTVYWDDGDGVIHATNVTNGKTLWTYEYDGSGNMASLDYYHGIVIAGFSQAYPTNVSALVGVYASNGSLAWMIKLPYATTSAVGDAVMAVYNGYLVDGFLGFAKGSMPLLKDINSRQVLLVANATTGKIIWTENVTNGTVHPGDTNNGYNPEVVNGVIYEPTIEGKVIAYNLTTGNILWESPKLSNGVLQAAPTYYNGYLLVPAGTSIAVLNSTNGNVINVFHTQFIMRQQMMVVCNTVIEASGTNYLFAVPFYDLLHDSSISDIGMS